MRGQRVRQKSSLECQRCRTESAVPGVRLRVRKRKMLHANRLRLLSPHEGLHNLVLELAHVARPTILAQELLCLVSERARPDSEQTALCPNAMRGERKNVRGPIAQRRELDMNDFQTKEEVSSKSPSAHLFGEILVARRD